MLSSGYTGMHAGHHQQKLMKCAFQRDETDIRDSAPVKLHRMQSKRLTKGSGKPSGRLRWTGNIYEDGSGSEFKTGQ